MEKIIQKASFHDAKTIAFLVSQSNKDIADIFGLTIENNPKHPSFCTEKWVLSDIDRGEEYFLCQRKSVYLGCVAFEQPDSKISYLNRLSVLPEYRHDGVGEQLVKHVLEYSKSKVIQKVSIGIIADHIILKNWYLKLGFIEGKTKSFDHLPFDVTFMSYDL
jgi:ribosomal protein S18 acetylase RimI-like enzyme